MDKFEKDGTNGDGRAVLYDEPTPYIHFHQSETGPTTLRHVSIQPAAYHLDANDRQ